MRLDGRRLLIAAWAAFGVAGCQPTTVAAPEATALAPAPLVKREGVSLADATVALVSLDGAPDAAAEDFRQALTRALAAREIAGAEPKAARYLLRVYLSAAPAEGGANLDYVVDVFDAHRARVGRLGDGVGLKGSGDAWSLASTQALEAAAGSCADDLAAFLSNRPEAKAAQALSYAPQ
jgi:hypothetical protein